MVAEKKSRKIPEINRNVSSHLTTVKLLCATVKGNGELYDAALSFRLQKCA